MQGMVGLEYLEHELIKGCNQKYKWTTINNNINELLLI